MTITVSAYCILCKKNVVGKLNEIVVLESGKWLHIGECPDCCYQIKRIMKTKIELEDRPQQGYSTGKWSDDDDVHPTITPVFGPNR